MLPSEYVDRSPEQGPALDRVVTNIFLRRWRSWGALVVPAHANADPSGLLCRMSGQSLEQMILHPELNAIGISPDLADAVNQNKITSNQKPFERKHRLAILHADDVMGPSDLKKLGATSWYKMSTDSLESLKHAIRTPETRVKLNDPTAVPRTLLREISWTGGFLDGVTLPLSEDLTTFIGGRGTGKSTAIESLRFALGIDPIGKKVSDDFELIVRDVLKSGDHCSGCCRNIGADAAEVHHRAGCERAVCCQGCERDRH